MQHGSRTTRQDDSSAMSHDVLHLRKNGSLKAYKNGSVDKLGS